MKQDENIKKLWNANQKLFKNTSGMSIAYFHNSPQKRFTTWQRIVNGGFHIALNRFKTIQILMRPTYGTKFYMECASLVRDLWDIWLTVAWLDHPNIDERNLRIGQLINSSFINQNLINEGLKKIPHVTEPDDAKWIRNRVQKICTTVPKKLRRIPEIRDMIKDFSLKEDRFKDAHPHYYQLVYKDLCNYAHFSWRTINEISISLSEKKFLLSLTQD